MERESYISNEIRTLFWPLYARKLKSDKSRKTYWSDIVSFTEILKKDFLEITQEDVDYFYYYHTKKAPVKLATLQKKFRELSAFSDFIAENITGILGRDIIFENYFFSYLTELNAQVQMAKGHIPTVQEMDKLLQLAAKNNIMHYAIFTLIYRCAVRPSELIRIRPADFLYNPEGCYLKVGEKKKERIIPLPEDVTDILEQYKRTRLQQIPSFFYNKAHMPFNERALERLVQEYAENAGISPITMYGIRDASVALMCACGAPASNIARDCGLTEIGVERYQQIIPSYTLKESAINLMRIRILPFDTERPF